MAEIQQLKAKRTKERTKTTKLISELKALFKAVHEDGRSTARYELDYNIEIGEAQLIQLEKLEDQLGALGVEDESAHIPDLHKAIGLGKRLLTELRQEATSQVPAMSQKPSFKLDFKLPKFNGDILAWPDFWEIYKASVHQNESYSAVQKLFYLRQHLDGAAAHAIQGLQLTAESYPVAIKILQDRFGKDDVRKESQITKLLSLPGVTNVDDLKSLRRLVDEVTAGVRSLEALNARDVGDVLLPVLKGKVPAAWRLQWARRRREQTTDDQGSEFPAFLEFLRNEVECHEEFVRVPGNKINEEPTRPSPTSHKSTTSILSTQQVSPQKTSSWACPACRKGQHGLGRCDKYLQMPIDDRWTTVKAAGACFQCLGRHRVRDCRSGTCRRCQRPHHTTLHRDPTTAPTTTPTSPSGASARIPEVQQSRTDPVSLTAQPLLRPDQHVGPRAKASDTGVNQQHQSRRYTVQGDRQQCYIQTALVEGRGPQCTKMLRVLLDGGSDASYIRKSVAEEMGLNVIGSGTFACVGFQERAEEPCTYDRVRIELRSRHGGDVKEFELWCSDRLCAHLPPAEPPIESLKDLILADDFSGGQIDILIGADQFYMAVLKDCVVLGEGLRALDTIFGHVLHGQGSAISQPPRHVYHCRQVEEMWDLDTIGITPETEITKTKFPDPTWNDDENRYEMGLLWSSEQRPVTNRYSSTVRVNRMVEKLDESKREEYNHNIIQLKQEGVIEPSPSSESAESAFFLPHRGLHRNNKLRIVFDGSAKDGTGVSLNTYLESGDNLLRRLVGVLLNFRSHDVACQADIKAAFHQIAVKEEDRQYLQFLWEGQTLRFRRVPFGLTCSPYMLLKSIEKHLSQYQPTYPELCTKLATGLYMDDVAVGFESVGEAAEQMNVVQEMFHDANMEIHKVRMTGLPSEDAKILGMRWSTGSDILAVTIPAAAPPVTKSQLLSVISRPFDPLGILSPWVIRGKILFQQTWTEEGCPSWESELPPAIGSQVEKWWKEAKTIEDVEIPRSVGKLCDETVFHVFCDASSKAYCAVVYAVHGGESRLVIAKARLAPLRPNITIPRLELMAALIGVRLMRFIKETLNTDTSNILYWTDSMDVLFWIRSKKPLKVFVENRVSAILENSRPDQWRHVGTGQNPADLGTRGITLKSLVASMQGMARRPAVSAAGRC